MHKTFKIFCAFCAFLWLITSVDRQNELVQALRKQLEATERELANQKWVFERFLQSHSWRMTYPIRWVARQARIMRNWILGMNPDPAAGKPSPAPEPSPSPPAEGNGVSQGLKNFLTSTYRARLQAFLASAAPLRLPCSNSPEISIIVVLYNRAELTLQCLRSIVEQGFEPLEIIIIDNASTDETPEMLDRLQGARIIRNNENRHFLSAVNQAAREARGRIHPASQQRHATAARHSRVGAQYHSRHTGYRRRRRPPDTSGLDVARGRKHRLA